MRSLTRALLLAAFLGALVSAQRAEVGGFIGGGGFGVSSGGTAAAGQLGIQACVFCSGRLGLFGEYDHWFTGTGSSLYAADRVRSADLAGAGLRIQSHTTIRFFFDVGFVGGEDQHNRFGRGGGLGGIVVGTGVEFPLREHWYIEPQFRIYGLSPHTIEGLDAHWAATGGVGLGYRF